MKKKILLSVFAIAAINVLSAKVYKSSLEETCLSCAETTSLLDESSLFSMNVLFSREISEAEKNQEVLNLQQFSSLGVPGSFKINGFGNIFKRNYPANYYIHIYFVKANEGITLLFRFNSASECLPNVNYKDGDNFYLLSGGNLNSVSFNDAQNYMSNFKQDFQNLYGKDTSKKITEYITHNLSDVNNNFVKFETETDLIIGAKQDGDALRMNIILSIPTADCKTATTTGTIAFYNMGTPRP